MMKMTQRQFIKRFGILSLCVAVLLFLTLQEWGVKGKVSVKKMSRELMKKVIDKGPDQFSNREITKFVRLARKVVSKGKSFHYLKGLRSAVERETRRLEDAEDSSSKNWSIRAYYSSHSNGNTLSFVGCRTCRPRRSQESCHMTKAELLLPLGFMIDENNGSSAEIAIEVDGRLINMSRGTVGISHAAIFDLTEVLTERLNVDSNGLDVTIRALSCQSVRLGGSTLIEYCNINRTILERFMDHGRDHDHEQSGQSETSGSVPHNAPVPKEEKPAEDDFDGLANVGGLSATRSSRTEADPAESGETVGGILDKADEETPITKRFRKIEEPVGHSSGNSMDHQSSSASYDDSDLKALSRAQRRQRHAKRSVGQGNSCIDHKVKMWKFGECTRLPWRYDFFSLGLRDISYPNSVDFGYCKGSCHHIFDFSHVTENITAHAVLANKNPLPTPMAACTPHKMSSIVVIRMNLMNYQDLVLEVLPDAVVKTCRCT